MRFFISKKIYAKAVSFFVTFMFLVESTLLPVITLLPRTASATTQFSASYLTQISSSGSIFQKLHYIQSLNSFYGIGLDNAIWKWDNSAKQWSRITDGSIKDDFHFISESDIYAIGMDNQVWHWNGIRWSQMSEGGKIQQKIWYADGNHIYGIGMDNQVWRYGSAGGWVQITSNGQIKDDFHFISENDIYGIGMDGHIWRWNGSAWSQISSGGTIKQKLHFIGPSDIWGIGVDNKIWKWNGGGWQQMYDTGQVKDDFAFDGSAAYGIGIDNQIWKWGAVSTSTTSTVPAMSTSVNLVVNNSDGPLSLSPGATAVISWNSQGFQSGDSCSASGDPANSSFGGSSVPVSGSTGVVFANAGTYTLQIVCYRGLRTTEGSLIPSASDFVIVNVDSTSQPPVVLSSGGKISQRLHVVSPTLMYGIGLDNKIWKWSDIAGWSPIAPGGKVKDDFTLVNNQENNIYGIGLDNAIWHWNGVSWGRVTMMPGQISQRLHVVSPTLMYGIGLDNKIWKWSDIAGWSQIAGSGQVKDDFTLVNNQENNIYGIGLDNHVWHWNGVSWGRVTMMPEQISQRLYVVSPTLMYGIGLDNKIWKWSDIAGWSQIAGSGQVKDDFTLVNNQENNIYAIGLDNHVWHWNGTNWQSIGAGVPQQNVLPGDYKESITIDGRERTYLLHIPTGYSVSKRYPLVAAFHGGGGTGAEIAQLTGFSEYADKEGFIAVFPDGIKNNWNDGRDTTDAYKAGADDVKFIRTLVEHLKGKLPIDNDRIFTTGVSNGGVFSHRLACEMSDVFAAIGSDVGAIASNLVPKCSPSKPISVVAIQGTDDPFMPINGGDTKHKILGIGAGGLVESAENTMKFWAGKNNCSNPPKTEILPIIVQDGTSVEKTTNSGCRNNVEVVYYIVNDMGHAWPPKTPKLLAALGGKTSKNIDATKTFWDFFKQHSKNSVLPIVIGPGKHTREVPGWKGRPYDLYIPPQYNSAKQWPVVLVLHGGGGSSAIAVQLTCPDGDLTNPKCLNKLAEREGFVTAYPSGTVNHQTVKEGRRWNAGGGKNGYACAGGFACAAGIDDIGYFNALLDDLQKAVSVDVNRVYATGLSNGGSMSHRLACELSNRIIAIAPLAAGNQFSAVASCQPARAVPVLQIHGTEDRFWPYLGGEGGVDTGDPNDKGTKISVPKTISDWVSRNGCASSPVETLTINPNLEDKTTVKKEVYAKCRDGVEVILYTVVGGGHTWPDGWQYLPKLVVGATSKEINANEIIWEFFKKYSIAASTPQATSSASRPAPTPTTAPMATLTMEREQEQVLPDQPVSFKGTLDSSLVAFPQGTSFFIAIPEKTEVQSIAIDGRTIGAGEFSVQNGGVKIPFSQSLYEGSHPFRVVLRNTASSIPQLDRNVAIWVSVVDANNKLLLKGRTASTLVAHLPTEVIGRGFSLSVPNTVTGQVGGMANCCWFSADKTHFIIREFGFGAMDITRGPFWTPNQVPLLPENIAFTLFPADASMQAVAFSLNQFSEPLAREFITAGYQYNLGRDPSNEEMSRYLPRFMQWRNPLLSLAEVHERRSDVRQAVLIPRDRNIGGNNSGSPRPSWDKLLEWAALYGWREEPSLLPFKLQTGFNDGWRLFQQLWNNLGVDPYHESYREVLESNANVDPLWAFAYLCEKSNQSRNHRLSSEVVDFEFCWKNDQIVRHKAILWAKDRMIFGPGEYPEEFAEEQALRYPPAQLYYDLLTSSEYASFVQNRFKDNIDSIFRLFFGRPASANDIAWVKNKFLGGEYAFTNPNNNSFGYDHTRSWINEYWEPNGVLVASNFDYRASEEFIKNQTFILDDVYGIRHTAGEIDAVSARLLEVIERLGRRELYEGNNFKQIVSGLYRLYVRRNPTDAEIDQHRASKKNFGDIEFSLNQSREYGKDPASRDAIKNLYRNYLGRDAGDSEIALWSGKTISSITQSMGKSAEMKTYAQQHPENAYIFPIKKIKIVKCGFFCSVFGKVLVIALSVVGSVYFAPVGFGWVAGIGSAAVGGLNAGLNITNRVMGSISRGFNEAGFNGETFVQWVSIARAMAGQAGGVFSTTNVFENADPTILDGFRTMARAPQTPDSGTFAKTEFPPPHYGMASLIGTASEYLGAKQPEQVFASAPAQLAQINISNHYGGGVGAVGTAAQQDAKTGKTQAAKKVIVKNLKRGSSGEEVLLLQKILGETDLVFLPEYRTGYYGPKTVAAVKRFQKRSGLPQVGTIGPKTRALLNLFGR